MSCILHNWAFRPLQWLGIRTSAVGRHPAGGLEVTHCQGVPNQAVPAGQCILPVIKTYGAWKGTIRANQVDLSGIACKHHLQPEAKSTELTTIQTTSHIYMTACHETATIVPNCSNSANTIPGKPRPGAENHPTSNEKRCLGRQRSMYGSSN